MVLLFLVVAGLVLGLSVGRWWALILPAGVGVVIGLTEDTEVGGVWLGAGYALVSGLGVLAGILVRRSFQARI